MNVNGRKGAGAADGPAGAAPLDLPAVHQPDSPLDEHHFAMIREALQRRAVIDKLIRRSRSSAMIMAVIAVGSLCAAVIRPGWDSGLVAAGLCAVAAIDAWGYQESRRGKSRAAGILGFNQLLLLAIVAAYCSYQMATFSPQSPLSPADQAALAGMPDVQAWISRWAPPVTYAFYGLVIAASLVFQGGLAVYYFTRRRRIDAANRETPAWIQRLFTEMQR